MEAVQIGEKIREFRERRDMSQETLASMVGKDQDAISEYERGVRKLPAHELPLYARALHVPVTFFFLGELRPEEEDMALVEWFHIIPSGRRWVVFKTMQDLTPLFIGEVE